MKKIDLIIDIGGVLILWDKDKTKDVDIWASEYVNEELLNYFLERKEIYAYSLLTNNYSEVGKLLHKKFNLPKFYKYIINSADIGISKPDPRIYRYALELLKAVPEECIFVDDNKLNVEAAIAIGMKGIEYKNFAQFKYDLEKNIL